MTGTADETQVGVIVELEVGAVAHGGHCVARGPDGRVVFVRHTLPGEIVRAEITDERPGYLRADAVEILREAPERVSPPCPYAGPDRCGGCDFQHVDPAAQRELKAAVVREQLARIGRLAPEEIDALRVTVSALPGGPLGWRSRLRYTVDAAGRAGLLKHRSHEVVPVESCAIATPAVRDAPVTGREWPDADAVEVVASSGGDRTVTALGGDRPARRIDGPDRVVEEAGGRTWRVDPAVFWQVHPAGADAFVGSAVRMLDPRPGERAWDLYGGAGTFAAALALAVGEQGAVTLVESDERAVFAASANLADLPQVKVVHSPVERMQVRGRPDVVVLDPPRAGAGTRVVRRLIESGPRAVAYVACDPAAFARDVATFRGAGWRLAEVDAYDAFPMTHHVECVGLLVPE